MPYPEVFLLGKRKQLKNSFENLSIFVYRPGEDGNFQVPYVNRLKTVWPNCCPNQLVSTENCA
jgi:hypothetical protein